MSKRKLVASVPDAITAMPQGWRAIMALTPLARRPLDLGDGHFAVGDWQYDLNAGLYANGKPPIYVDMERGDERARLRVRLGGNLFSLIAGGGKGNTCLLITGKELEFGYSLGTHEEPNPVRAMFEHTHRVISQTLPGVAARFGGTVSLSPIEPHRDPAMAAKGAMRSVFEWPETEAEALIPCTVGVIVHCFNVMTATALTWERHRVIGGEAMLPLLAVPPLQLPASNFDGTEKKSAA